MARRWCICRSISPIAPDRCIRCARWPSFFLPLLFCNYLMHCDFRCAYMIVRAIDKCHSQYCTEYIWLEKNMIRIFMRIEIRQIFEHVAFKLKKKKIICNINIATIFVCTVFLSLTRIKLERWSTVKKCRLNEFFFGFLLMRHLERIRKRWREVLNWCSVLCASQYIPCSLESETCNFIEWE